MKEYHDGALVCSTQKDTVDVPGTALLLVGLSPQPKPDTHSDDHNLPSPPEEPNQTSSPPRDDDPPNTTPTGILLAPQPLPHDLLSWPPWRHNLALLTIGLYSLLGGGTTPLLAAGFTNISQIFSIPRHRISLTTDLVMLGLGIGCLLASPTAILYGKRPVYLAGSLIFLLTCVWCALSPTFESLLLARFVQGVAISPVEALPSATIAELFFCMNEGAGAGGEGLWALFVRGKNLVPVMGAGGCSCSGVEVGFLGDGGWGLWGWVVGVGAGDVLG
ncbi:hypothetical protein QC764_0038900 [Podospora pseudoanserina]|uniref:Major facilitator superfamily (MFS) profile domain-containing protein n=1 Tax=Podospora pseudoanserina TaxID=2609844 RepID=A0ABR0IHG8_9PEZI|nr:hypothetical protein QC764_0038900 [Podospora pseudoanserina]